MSRQPESTNAVSGVQVGMMSILTSMFVTPRREALRFDVDEKSGLLEIPSIVWEEFDAAMARAGFQQI